MEKVWTEQANEGTLESPLSPIAPHPLRRQASQNHSSVWTPPPLSPEYLNFHAAGSAASENPVQAFREISLRVVLLLQYFILCLGHLPKVNPVLSGSSYLEYIRDLLMDSMSQPVSWQEKWVGLFESRGGGGGHLCADLAELLIAQRLGASPETKPRNGSHGRRGGGPPFWVKLAPLASSRGPTADNARQSTCSL